MSKETKPQPQPQPKKEQNNVVAITERCTAEECKAKPERASFCKEHFAWFKEGLITKDGKRPKDFQKKYAQYMSRKAA